MKYLFILACVFLVGPNSFASGAPTITPSASRIGPNGVFVRELCDDAHATSRSAAADCLIKQSFGARERRLKDLAPLNLAALANSICTDKARGLTELSQTDRYMDLVNCLQTAHDLIAGHSDNENRKITNNLDAWIKVCEAEFFDAGGRCLKQAFSNVGSRMRAPTVQKIIAVREIDPDGLPNPIRAPASKKQTR